MNLEKKSGNINAYLVEAKNAYVQNESSSISKLPEINFGNMANDGGYLLLSEQEKEKLLRFEPSTKEFIRDFKGAWNS